MTDPASRWPSRTAFLAAATLCAVVFAALVAGETWFDDPRFEDLRWVPAGLVVIALFGALHAHHVHRLMAMKAALIAGMHADGDARSLAAPERTMPLMNPHAAEVPPGVATSETNAARFTVWADTHPVIQRETIADWDPGAAEHDRDQPDGRMVRALTTIPAPAAPYFEPAEVQDALLDEAFLTELTEEIGADGISEVTQIFMEEGPLRVAAIERAMAEGAISTLRREAHALAGAARNLGLVRLGNAAYALQTASEAAGPTEAAVKAIVIMLRETLPLMAGWNADGRVALRNQSRVKI